MTERLPWNHPDATPLVDAEPSRERRPWGPQRQMMDVDTTSEDLRVPGVAAQQRRLARLGASDVVHGPCSGVGLVHAKCHAQIGRVVKEFDVHGAPGLERALDALVETIEAERRSIRRKSRR